MLINDNKTDYITILYTITNVNNFENIHFTQNLTHICNSNYSANIQHQNAFVKSFC